MTDDQMTGDIDDYANRVLDALREAQTHGVQAYCILYANDPLSQTTSTRYVRTADHILAMGLLQAAMMYAQDEHLEADDDDEEVSS
jgi:Asp/Glu/hydantoin racemase